jgi:transcriptional regulator with XRE-family HTH domain
MTYLTDKPVPAPRIRHRRKHPGKPIPVRIAFAVRVEGLRKSAGMTRVQLCERSGVSENAIRTWERPDAEPRRGLPNLETLLLVARALDMTVSELLKGVC